MSVSSNEKTVGPDVVKAKLAQWLKGVETRDVEMLLDVLDPDITLKTPFEPEAFHGKANVLQTFKLFDSSVEGFEYGRVIPAEGVAVLFFSGKVGEETLQGTDIFHFNEAGKVNNIEVFARHIGAISKLKQSIDRAAKALETA